MYSMPHEMDCLRSKNCSAMVSISSDFWICKANQGKRETKPEHHETGAKEEQQ
ncbi:hypothetical protein AB9M62_35465 [Bacillales bacterium AN1005]